jgi:cullin 3
MATTERFDGAVAQAHHISPRGVISPTVHPFTLAGTWLIFFTQAMGGGHGGGDDFEAMWAILQSALREIHEKNASKLSFEQLYRASYKIVLKKQGDRLYDRVKEYEEQWFGSQVMPTIRRLITSNLVNISLGGVSGTTANERRVTGEEFLKGLKASWEDHNTVMNMTTDVLMYMDRVYCQDFRKASIFTTSMGLFRDHILRSRLASSDQDLVTFDILNSVILDQISMEREGDVINRHLIRSCMYMLEGLYETDEEHEHEKLYLTVFEPAFLKASTFFYQNECNNLLREGDASSWLKQTRKRFAEEEDRCQTTISLLTFYKIAKVIENAMIREHLPEFLAMEGSGIKAMIENDRYEDLTLLYQHVSRIDPSKEPLKLALQARVVDLGSEINKTIQNTDFSASTAPQEDGEAAESGEKSKAPKLNATARATMAAIKWVDEVLRLKDKFDTMWKRCLNEDLILQTALTKSFSDFINLFPRCSEYVSLFIDDNLKRGIKGKTEAEIDEVLDKAVTLLRYIQDKDMFERYYKKHLARRLLYGKSESADVEKQMISRMKLEIGNSFTLKLEGMFKDMTMSEDLSAGYRDHMDGLGDIGRTQPDLGVNVLTSNFWPMESMGGGVGHGEEGSRPSCQFPPEILTLQESFKKFYLKERSGRVLTWLGFLGSADVRCVFPKIPGKEGALGRERRHEITVPTYGMIILLLFNDLAEGETLSFEEIQERTNMSTQDLSRQLTALAVIPKTKVLHKHPNTKESPKLGDAFSFNASFTSKNIKLKAPVIAGSINKVEGEDERKETEDRNDEHRGNVIDTVIVRIMKYIPAILPLPPIKLTRESGPARNLPTKTSSQKSSPSSRNASSQT